MEFAREHEGYEGSGLHFMHILIEEKGAEWVTNCSSYEYKLATMRLADKFATKEYVNRWSDEDIAYIRSQRGLKTYAQMGKKIGRTASGIKQKLVELNKCQKQDQK